MMEHHIARDLLEGYVDGTLEPETREAVEEHLAGCSECRALIEGVEPIRFSDREGVPVPSALGWDEDRMKMVVRRSLTRITFDVVTWLVIGVLAVGLFSAFVVQPVVIDRGGRVGDALTATWDLAVMLQPGAEVSAWRSDPGVISRSLEVTTVLPVGGGTKDLGTFRARLGVWGFSGEHGGPLSPGFRERALGTGRDVLARLPSGTVTTVEARWFVPIDVETAAGLADVHPDVSVTWVGFAVGPERVGGATSFGEGGSVGYSTCTAGPPRHMIENAGSGGTGGSASEFFGSTNPSSAPGVAHALNQVRRALNNLLSRGEFVDGLARHGGPSRASVEQAGDWVAKSDPGVVTMVVTGPTELVAEFVDDAGPSAVDVRAVEFWNWSGPICGGR